MYCRLGVGLKKIKLGLTLKIDPSKKKILFKQLMWKISNIFRGFQHYTNLKVETYTKVLVIKISFQKCITRWVFVLKKKK